MDGDTPRHAYSALSSVQSLDCIAGFSSLITYLEARGMPGVLMVHVHANKRKENPLLHCDLSFRYFVDVCSLVPDSTGMGVVCPVGSRDSGILFRCLAYLGYVCTGYLGM